MSLRYVNLNLLPILRALLRERNLSRAARMLGLSQPAVSAALTRLRIIFKDPLLIRRGRGMELTLRATELVDAVERLCSSLEDLLESEQFDPAQCERRFVIVGADYAVVAIAPVIIRQLMERAPKAAVHFIDIPHPAIESHGGEIDFYLVPELLFHEGKYPPLRWTPLIQDEFVTVVADGHPLTDLDAPTRADLLAERYVLYYPALSLLDHTIISAVTGRTQGRHIVAQIQQFTLLPALVVDTGCAAIVPRRVADYMERFMPIRVVDDGPLPIYFDQCLAWNPARDSDPAHRWFRQLIVDNCLMTRDRTS